MLKVGDIVKPTPEAWDHWRNVLPTFDTLLNVSKDSQYKIDHIGHTGWVTIIPIDLLCDYGTDGLLIDKISRNFFSDWLVDGDIEKTFVLVNDNPVSQPHNPVYCSCKNPNLVQSQTLGNSFFYCRNCKKEKI